MWSTIVARVVVLPEPVGPVTRIEAALLAGQVVDGCGQTQLVR